MTAIIRGWLADARRELRIAELQHAPESILSAYRWRVETLEKKLAEAE